MAEQLLIGVVFAALISISSFLARLLTFSGAIARFVLGTVLLGFGGWQWTVPMVVFFLLSSLISRIGKHRRSEAESLFEKSSRRDAQQVFANGGIAGVVTLIWFLTRDESLYAAFLGSIAAATADTWGTEIGTLSRSSPILITTFKRVDCGTSGGVSLLGLLAGVAGSLTIGISGLAWIPFTPISLTLFAVLLGGMGGSLVDSFLGATLQVQYRCTVCGKRTERIVHCGSGTGRFRGRSWIKNDQVNVVCTLVGACVGFFVSRM